MGAGHVLCDNVLRRRMRTCVLSVSSMVRSVGLSVDSSTTSRHFGAETKRAYYFHKHSNDLIFIST